MTAHDLKIELDFDREGFLADVSKHIALNPHRPLQEVVQEMIDKIDDYIRIDNDILRATIVE